MACEHRKHISQIQPPDICRADHCNADLVHSNGGYICLTILSPINFYKIGPRAHSKVMAQSDPARAIPIRCESGPPTNAGMESVSAHDPSAADRSTVEVDAAGIKSLDLFPPQCHDTHFVCTFHQNPMKLGSAHPQAEALIRKRCFGFELLVQKSDATEADSISVFKIHPDAKQRIKRIGHKTFATGLVDWRLSTIREDDIEAHLARSQSRGESGRPTANDEHISLSWHEA